MAMRWTRRLATWARRVLLAPIKSFLTAAVAPTGAPATVTRRGIVDALKDMVEHEEGTRFQSLAVILARQTWPQLTASERWKDRGLDAYAPGSDQKPAMGLACSTTASVKKIKSDLTKIREHYPEVRQVVFFTADTVTRHTEQKWKDEVEESFGVRLTILSREHLIISLLDPTNAPLCRNHLRLSVGPDPQTEDVSRAAKAACRAAATNWRHRPRLPNAPLIRLRLALIRDEAEADVHDFLDLEAVDDALSTGRRIVLQAPAGAGKTTTLVQLARLKTDHGDLCLIVDLPAWINSGSDILDFIGRSPDFLSEGVGSFDLARLSRAEHVDFLFNGWNEVSDRSLESARLKLADVERAYPSAGILVATRAGLPPPLPGAIRVRVLDVTDEQRHDYLSAVLGDQAGELEARIKGDATLEALTGNPLILAEVAELCRSGRPIPDTTLEILNSMAERIQDSEEHRPALLGTPISGLSTPYLSALANSMLRSGSAAVDEESARRAVTDAAENLRADGQIATVPEPSSILRELCAHHVLEQVDYPGVSFRFQHQRFQEVYTALDIIHQLAVVTIGGDAPVAEFQAEYLNRPALEPSFLLVAEAIAGRSAVIGSHIDVVEAGTCLVEWTIGIDALFAATLARTCGREVWHSVGADLSILFRAWFARGDEHRRRYALACMLATGSSDFADIIVPLVTSEDQQVSLGAYRALGHFYPSSLGPEWRDVVARWNDEQRATFLGEVVTTPALAEVAEEFAENDPSERVRAAAMQALEWIGSTERLERVSRNLTDAALADALLSGFAVESLPASLNQRVVTAVRNLLQGSHGSATRIQLATRAARLANSEIDQLKTEVGNLSATDTRSLNEYTLDAALSVLQSGDPTWTTHWIAERIADGDLGGDRWIRRVSAISAALRDHLLQRALAENLEHRDGRQIMPLLAHVGDQQVARAVCLQLVKLEEERADGWPQGSAEEQSSILRQLKDLARDLGPSLLASAILDAVSEPVTVNELGALLDVVGVIGDEWGEFRAGLTRNERDSLRSFLAHSLPLVLAQDDFYGSLKAALALALGRIGEPEDVRHIEPLIAADIQRVQVGMEARRARQAGPAADGAATTYACWFTRGLSWLGEAAAAPVLLRLLDEVEYEDAAASALARIVMNPSNTQPNELFARDLSTSVTADEDEESRSRYANAIASRIRALLAELEEGQEPELLTFRLKRLAVVLASLDRGESTDLLLRVMGLRGTWDAWYRLDALEHMIRRGVRPPAEATLAVLHPTIEQLADRTHYNDQTQGLMDRIHCVLPFLDDPERGVNRVRELLAERPLPDHRLASLIGALATSGSESALDLLVDLYEQSDSPSARFATEWIRAMARMDLPRARSLLVGFLDPDIDGVTTGLPREVIDTLAAEIANVASRRPETLSRVIDLCSVELSSIQRELLAQVIAELGSLETVVAGLSLIADDASPPVPFALRRAMERALVEHRQRGSRSGFYTLVPRNGAAVRSKLFSYFESDDFRRRSAEELLGEVDEWRIEYGKPSSEPRHPAIASGSPWPPPMSDD